MDFYTTEIFGRLMVAEALEDADRDRLARQAEGYRSIRGSLAASLRALATAVDDSRMGTEPRLVRAR